MHPRDAMRRSRSADPLPPFNPLPTADLDRIKIGNRHLQTCHRFDGDTPHPGDTPSEGDPTRGGSMDRIPHRSTEVDAPMAPIPPDRRERSDHWAIDRRHKTDHGNRQGCKHFKKPPLPNLRDFDTAY